MRKNTFENFEAKLFQFMLAFFIIKSTLVDVHFSPVPIYLIKDRQDKVNVVSCSILIIIYHASC